LPLRRFVLDTLSRMEKGSQSLGPPRARSKSPQIAPAGPAETVHGDNSVPPAVCCRALAPTSPDRQQSCIGSASDVCSDNPGSAVRHAFHSLPYGGATANEERALTASICLAPNLDGEPA
jgi:hypothetical protein